MNKTRPGSRQTNELANSVELASSDKGKVEEKEERFFTMIRIARKRFVNNKLKVVVFNISLHGQNARRRTT